MTNVIVPIINNYLFSINSKNNLEFKMYNHIENVLESDPLKLKKYNTPYYKVVYSVCVLIPTLIAFSIVFFLIFYMSPHDKSLRQY